MLDSLDILYYVLAVCAVWITLATCWFLWRVALLLKTIYDTLSLVREQLRKIDQTVEYFKVKVDHSTSHLGGIARQMSDAFFHKP